VSAHGEVCFHCGGPVVPERDWIRHPGDSHPDAARWFLCERGRVWIARREGRGLAWAEGYPVLLDRLLLSERAA
jgi:hypothetical protein